MAGLISEFQIYRCDISSGTCIPSQPLVTVTDPTARFYVDTGVVAGQMYCYAISFRHQSGCVSADVYESPLSNTDCKQTCTVPPGGPTDVAFIVDNTGSMGNAPLTKLRNGIASILDDIEASSGVDYRLALVTPDDDQVNVRVSFSANNRTAFTAALNADLSTPGRGNNPPESTDECLNTIVNALAASARTDPRGCQLTPVQIGDFTPGFRLTARKLIVMITDHEPGGFCDFGDGGAQAAIYAAQAHDNGNCIRINAIQISNNSDATAIMLNYRQTTCGWYEQIPSDGTGIADSVASMLFAPPYCACP